MSGVCVVFGVPLGPIASVVVVVDIHLSAKKPVPSSSTLLLADLSQTSNGRSDGSGGWRAEGVGTTGVDLLAWLAFPDTDGGSLDGVL